MSFFLIRSCSERTLNFCSDHNELIATNPHGLLLGQSAGCQIDHFQVASNKIAVVRLQMNSDLELHVMIGRVFVRFAIKLYNSYQVHMIKIALLILLLWNFAYCAQTNSRAHNLRFSVSWTSIGARCQNMLNF